MLCGEYHVVKSLLDAAILFSDILVVPHALGQRVTFEQGEGPRLDALKDPSAIDRLCREIDQGKLEPVYETLGKVKQELPAAVTLLGFCGAPWTLATYMIAGCGTVDQFPARTFAYRFPEAFSKLIDILVDASASYLIRQFSAGAEAVQIFDTWAGILPAGEFRKWCIEPTARIVEAVRKEMPGAKIIGFPRGAGTELGAYLDAVGVDGVGLDWTTELGFGRDEFNRDVRFRAISIRWRSWSGARRSIGRSILSRIVRKQGDVGAKSSLENR